MLPHLVPQSLLILRLIFNFVCVVIVCMTVCGYVIVNLIMILEEKSIGTQGPGSKLILSLFLSGTL